MEMIGLIPQEDVDYNTIRDYMGKELDVKELKEKHKRIRIYSPRDFVLAEQEGMFCEWWIFYFIPKKEQKWKIKTKIGTFTKKG